MLVFALGLVFLSAVQLAYRFTLPTDGWAVLTTDNFDAPDWVYLENIVGAPSGLRRDEIVTTVNGQPVQGLASNAYVPPPPGWGANQTVEMGVERQHRPLLLAVPVVHWTPHALWRHITVRPELLVGLLGALTFFALALFTFYQRSDLPAARALLILSATFLAINVSGLLPDGLSVQFNKLAFYTTGVFSYLIFGVLLAPALFAFSLLFPRPKRVIQCYPWLALLPFAIGVLVGATILAGQVPVVGWLSLSGKFGVCLDSHRSKGVHRVQGFADS